MRIGKSFISWRRIVTSAKFFIIHRFVPKKVDILFYYPSHFNRGEDRSNELFEPLYQWCEEQHISYLVFEEPSFLPNDRQNRFAIPFDFVFITLIILRKFLRSKTRDFPDTEKKVAKIINLLFLKNIHFGSVIVLSQSLLYLLRQISPNAAIYDYQHGIIHSLHPAYLQKGAAPDELSHNDVTVLVYGTGFKNLMQRNDRSKYYDTHIKVLGYPYAPTNDQFSQTGPRHSRRLLFTSSIVDGSENLQRKQYEKILDFFQNNASFFEKNGLIVMFRHHPRYQNTISMDELFELSFIKHDNDKLEKTLQQVFLHLTFVSTVTFDAAAFGIPTILWDNDFFDTQKIFLSDFRYPLGMKKDNQIVQTIETYLRLEQDYLQDADSVKHWFREFYEPLHKDSFLSLTPDQTAQ